MPSPVDVPVPSFADPSAVQTIAYTSPSPADSLEPSPADGSGSTHMTVWTGALPEHDFSRIDRYALKTPSDETESIPVLAAWLVRPAHNDLEKARAVYRWVTANIRYDTDALAQATPLRSTALDTLLTRRGVCEGYARLFARLCQQAGLKAVWIGGYGRGARGDFSAAPGPAGMANHAWNAVMVDGRWRLVDATWGAGSIDPGTDRYVAHFQSAYFDMPARAFVMTHLPSDARWQLLNHPISAEEQARLPYLSAEGLEARLSCTDFPGCALETSGDIVMHFAARRGEAVSGRLFRNGQPLAQRVFAQPCQGGFALTLAPPAAGSYVLRVFVARAGDRTAPLGAQYRVQSDAASVTYPNGFPEIYRAFNDARAEVATPLSGRLAAGSAQAFDLRVPGASYVAVITADHRFHYLDRQGQHFCGSVTLVSGPVRVGFKLAEPGGAPGSRAGRYRLMLGYVAR